MRTILSIYFSTTRRAYSSVDIVILDLVILDIVLFISPAPRAGGGCILCIGGVYTVHGGTVQGAWGDCISCRGCILCRE